MSNSPLVDYVLISPHKTSPRVYPITKITIHHMAGNLTVEQCGKLFQSREACSNYGIDGSGRVGMYCEEKDRAWCSADYDNDHRAINIELANDGGAPDWHVSDVTLNKCIELCVDICKRNGIERLFFTGDKTGNLTQHNYFCNTACPGPYLKSKFSWIADQVNAQLQQDPSLVKLKIGFASDGDIRTFGRLLETLEVACTVEEGFIYTDWVDSGKRSVIEEEAVRLVVPCIVVETSTDEPADPDPVEDPEQKYKELLQKYEELEIFCDKLKKAIDSAEDILYNAMYNS